MERKCLDCFLASPEPSGKSSTYFDAYDNLLAKYQDRKITFVEIGVLNGGSLFMWRNFFGPEARIIGIDLNPAAKQWESNDFEIFIGSQSNPGFWSNFFSKVGDIDVLLDDGGHTFEQQIITSECVVDHIKDDGMLIVEDTHTSYLTGFGDNKASFINYAKLQVDRINSRYWRFEQAQPQKDRRIWSIEFFESIVAFKVNRKFSEVKSDKLWNKRPNVAAEDFRHRDNASEESFNKKNDILKSAFTFYPTK